MPSSINATLCTSEDTDCYTILVNKNKPIDVLRESIAHEVCHIMEGHFTQDMHAGLIESLLHGNEADFNHEEVNFYYQFID
nr:MAG TPA: IrrE N-terminal-like domain [Caudoviricetes sp.]DAY96134.1 MAG TPA: IrrE N-terminal-like domain [Caudoviricetes sp.]